MHLSLALAIFASLLIVISLVQPAAARAGLSSSVLLAVVGIVIGLVSELAVSERFAGGIGEIAEFLQNPPINSHMFLSIFLPLLLFQTSLSLELRQLSDDAAPIFTLAVIAVVAATFAIGFALWPFSGLPLVACLMLGAIVATTDPVAVVGIFRDVGAPSRLGRLVEGESLLNDAAAITLFTLLLSFLMGGAAPHPLAGLAIFIKTFLGGIAVGYCLAFAVVRLLPVVRDFRPAQVSLSLALPYLSFVVAEEMFEVSGVVAVVTAGLVFTLGAPVRVRPDDWEYLREVWEQIEFWASSLIFILAALLVPKLLIQIEWSDLGLLIIVIVAALLSRAVVLFGGLPILSAAKLSERISNPFKLVILWGGMRGAITLALALAVTENALISPEIQRFVAVLATGFVLFTLLVYGTTLRPLVRLLKLDQLTPFDTALRSQLLKNAQSDLTETTLKLAKTYHIDPTVADNLFRISPAGVANWAEAGDGEEIADTQRLVLGLVTVAAKERQLILDKFRDRTLSAVVASRLLPHASRLVDQARANGRLGYNRSAARILAFTWRWRLSQWLHRRLGIERFMSDLLSQRFERLMVLRIVIEELPRFIEERVEPLLGARVSKLLNDILVQRREATVTALDALKLQYPEYATALERRLLYQSAVRTEELECERMFEEGMIGPELFGELRRRIATEREMAERLPRLDLGLDPQQLVAQVPLFARLSQEQRGRVADLLTPHFAVPGEVLVREGERGSTMFFISSGAVQVTVRGAVYRLGRGDFFGEMALLSRARRLGDVRALGFCQLLILSADDLTALTRSYPEIQHQIDAVARQRQAMNRTAER
ncbi:CPA1 family monovalent cation:H+ antiporter [Rhodoligotrophos appendicifer]|uniref:cation:proton antiporter n=1 Tax=Rhodoligotrophos appendicifer TaxID=987056 RepID=UPI001184B329|nr:cation:proton antiporter [Rhodoligotrophos appendicifer]